MDTLEGTDMVDKRAQTGVVGLQSESVALLYLHSPPQSSKGNNLSRKLEK
jgi:hypothetical protein